MGDLPIFRDLLAWLIHPQYNSARPGSEIECMTLRVQGTESKHNFLCATNTPLPLPIYPRFQRPLFLGFTHSGVSLQTIGRKQTCPCLQHTVSRPSKVLRHHGMWLLTCISPLCLPQHWIANVFNPQPHDQQRNKSKGCTPSERIPLQLKETASVLKHPILSLTAVPTHIQSAGIAQPGTYPRPSSLVL